MLHVSQATSPRLSFGSNYKNNLVSARRQAWSYFTYAAQDEVKQAHLKQAALCQVYEDFTGIYTVAVACGFTQVFAVSLERDLVCWILKIHVFLRYSVNTLPLSARIIFRIS